MSDRPAVGRREILALASAILAGVALLVFWIAVTIQWVAMDDTPTALGEDSPDAVSIALVTAAGSLGLARSG